MPHYYRLDSSGEDTNLQLYSLRQARKYWRELRHDYAQDGEVSENLRERCVFILATLGLSISQLLGQNEPTPGGKVRYPIEIFKDFVNAYGLDPNLIERFERFNYFYNGCRHFGATTTGAGYSRVNQLTYERAIKCFEFGIDVWRTVIGVFRDELGADLEEFNIDDLPDDSKDLC